MDDLSDQLRNRLQHLIDSAQQDSQSLQSSPDGQKLFQELFDALQSTLQNVDKSSAERTDS
jgi:hypothetical protein